MILALNVQDPQILNVLTVPQILIWSLENACALLDALVLLQSTMMSRDICVILVILRVLNALDLPLQSAPTVQLALHLIMENVSVSQIVSAQMANITILRLLAVLLVIIHARHAMKPVRLIAIFVKITWSLQMESVYV